ncbi:FadR/GntR family transcriptional regulator [Terrihabitans sp. B22-R8]|uniref:FadR/GntR family transcriptional regulator n=1 Tax=Terrihabitans sp. B22-R8 TaxID=3425128 RepID=UPI00403D386D
MKSLVPKSLKKVARTSLVDEVIEAIRVMLQEEGWSTGARLPSEQQLSIQLGVGRSTVREALRVLGHLGLVQSRSGLGTFVTGRDFPERQTGEIGSAGAILQFFEFRRTIEVPAARLAAERRSAIALAAIEDAWQKCYNAALNGDVAEFADFDHRFHLSIIEATENPFMINAYRSIHSDFITHVSVMLGLGPLRQMLHFHDDLIRAIRQQDPAMAMRAVEDNFVDTDVRQKMILSDEICTHLL